VISHPSLQNLPFKIELNAKGVIEMSPASIQTNDGVHVADVVWAEDAYIQANKHQTPF
jgi:hypothetical protein